MTDARATPGDDESGSDRGRVVHHDNDPGDDRLCVVRRVPMIDRFTGDIRIVPKMRCVRGF